MRSKTHPEVEQSTSSESSAAALQAVQVALDRRDNGGRAAASSAT